MSTQPTNTFLNLLNRRKTGRLKIYIGMIAGVGKTYKMLMEAHDLLNAGVDVKIGYIESHDREETKALTRGLPTISRKQVFYKGRALEEMDLEHILLEKPEVVLVDELAHSNIPGSKNRKRWEDVIELLNNGINVITAFNVQHLDSMIDKVKKITNIEVSETIPDKIFEFADEVVNIDLPADDLINRLKAGKIYKGDRIDRALNNFFQPEKILQLRDLALRQVVMQVDNKIKASLPDKNQYPQETFLACISTNYEGGQKIIRKTSRMAQRYQATWYVMYVQSAGEDTNKIDLAIQRKLLNNLKWAAELGAEIIRKKGDNIPELIHDVAIEKRVNNIVLGKPHFSLFRQLTGRNYFDKLLKKLIDKEIDIIIIF